MRKRLLSGCLLAAALLNGLAACTTQRTLTSAFQSDEDD
jgi:hypothetical protein